jgi:hypothetical protein
MLADARSEHEGVDPAGGGRQRTELAPYAVDEQLDCEPGAGVVAPKQGSHVARQAGHAKQPRLLVDQRFDGSRIHAQLVHQVKDDAGIEIAAARPHRQPVHRGEAHGAGHAAAIHHRAHAAAVSKVRNHGAPRAGLGIELRQHGGDVLVRQAMEAIAPHAKIGDRGRQGESLRRLGLHAMECGVETGDLRQLRAKLRDDLDRLEVVGLVQRRQWAELPEFGNHFRLDSHGLRERLAAMHDPVAHGDELVAPAVALKEIDQVGDRPAVPEFGALLPGLRIDGRALRILGHESRLRVEAFDLALEHQRELVAAGVEGAELEAG